MPFDPEVPQQAPEPQIKPFDVALKELVEALGAAPAAQALVEGGASPREAVHAVERVATPRLAPMPSFDPSAVGAAIPNALSGDFDTSDVLARMPPQGPRVPFYGENNMLMPEPKGREGAAQYLELPGMRLPLDIAERPVHHAVGMARTAPMMMGMTGNAPGWTTGAIKSVIENVPKAPAAAATALTGLMAAPGRAGEQDPDAVAAAGAAKQLYEERARLEQQIRDATARREAARPKNRAPTAQGDPIFTEAANEVSKLEAQKSANDTMIKDHVRRNSPEFALEMKEKAETQERLAREKRATTPTRELYSDYMPALPFVSGTLALLGGAALKGRSMANFQTEIADLSNRISQALAAARAAAARKRRCGCRRH